MHELSIATALLARIEQLAPPGQCVRGVTIRVGPMRLLDPQAISLAWQSATADSRFAVTELELLSLPWQLECCRCGQRFKAADLYARCACGADETFPVGGDELEIIELRVDVPESVITGDIQ